MTPQRQSAARKATVIAIAMLMVGAAAFQFGKTFANPSSSQVAVGGQWQEEKPCTFYLFTDGTNYYSQNCDTGGITYGGPANAGGVTGTSFFSTMQTTLNNMCTGGILSIGLGTFSWTSAAGTITIPNCVNGRDIIQGQGSNYLPSSTILAFSGSAATAIRSTGGRATFDDFGLTGAGGASIGLNLTGVAENYGNGLTVSGFTTDLWMGGNTGSDNERNAFTADHFNDAVVFDTTIHSPCGQNVNLVEISDSTINGGFVNGDKTCFGGTANTLSSVNVINQSTPGNVGIVNYGNNLNLINIADEANNIIVHNEGGTSSPSSVTIIGGDLLPPSPSGLGGLGIKNDGCSVRVENVRRQSFSQQLCFGGSGGFFSPSPSGSPFTFPTLGSGIGNTNAATDNYQCVIYGGTVTRINMLVNTGITNAVNTTIWAGASVGSFTTPMLTYNDQIELHYTGGAPTIECYNEFI